MAGHASFCTGVGSPSVRRNQSDVSVSNNRKQSFIPVSLSLFEYLTQYPKENFHINRLGNMTVHTAS